jgi:hypothetical protein
VFVDKHLTIDTRFTGEWIVGGNVSGDNRNLVINEIGVDGSASGSYLGNAVTFTYNSTANSLTFTYGNTTYYLRTVGSTGVIELTLTVLNSTTSGYVTCVKENTLDSFGGTYTATDGGYVYLDGLGESTYGSGTAVQYNKDGNLVATYSYSINKFGMVELLTTTYSTRIFKEVTASTDGAYENGSKAYTIVTPDFLYLESATDVDDSTITYSFDGVGGVTASNGKSYSYTISAQSDNDSVDNVYRLVFVSGGVTYDAVLDYGTSDYMLTVTARKA